MVFSLWGFVVSTTGSFVLSHVLLFVLMFFESCLAFWSPHLGKRGLVYVLLVLVFVYFAHVQLCPFSLPLGVRDWLRLNIFPFHILIQQYEKSMSKPLNKIIKALTQHCFDCLKSTENHMTCLEKMYSALLFFTDTIILVLGQVRQHLVS